MVACRRSSDRRLLDPAVPVTGALFLIILLDDDDDCCVLNNNDADEGVTDQAAAAGRGERSSKTANAEKNSNLTMLLGREDLMMVDDDRQAKVFDRDRPKSPGL